MKQEIIMHTSKFLFTALFGLATMNTACSNNSSEQSQASTSNPQNQAVSADNANQNTESNNSKATPAETTTANNENSPCPVQVPNDDKDLLSRGNLQLLEKHGIQVSQCQVMLNDQSFKIDIYKKEPIGNVRYLALHDSEDAAFDGGLDAIKDGGLMVVLENNEQRYFYDQAHQSVTKKDPNRIFTPSDEFFPLGEFILQQLHITPNAYIISLHNNNPDGGFGMKNIKKYGATDILCHQHSDDKNLFWLPYSATTPDIKELGDKLCAKGIYNVVLENVPAVADGDGSLSIYAANQGYQYVNIEIRAAKRNNVDSEQLAKSEQIKHIQEFLQAVQ